MQNLPLNLARAVHECLVVAGLVPQAEGQPFGAVLRILYAGVVLKCEVVVQQTLEAR